jgi:hypothetical protein
LPNLLFPDLEAELSDLLHRFRVVEREAAVVQLGVADLLLPDVLVVQVTGKTNGGNVTGLVNNCCT